MVINLTAHSHHFTGIMISKESTMQINKLVTEKPFKRRQYQMNLLNKTIALKCNMKHLNSLAEVCVVNVISIDFFKICI